MLRDAIPGVRREQRAEEAGVEHMLPAHHTVPLKRVVGSLEDELPDLDEWRHALRSFVEPLLGEPLPEAALAVNAADLLLENGGVPFGVELNDDATGLMQVEPLTPDLALRDENPRRGSRTVERGLDVAPVSQRVAPWSNRRSR